MKIVIGLVSLEAGGTEFQMCLLANSLRERGHNVLFYVTSLNITPSMLSQFPPFEVRYRPPFGVDRTDVQFIANIFKWRKFLKQDRPDVIIGALSIPHMILVNASIGLGIHTIGRRGFAWEDLDHIPQYRKIKTVLQRYRKYSEWRTDYLVVNANHVARSVHYWEGWRKEKIRVIHNGWPEFPPSPDNPRLVYAARMRIEKYHDTLTRYKGDLDISYVTDTPDWNNGGVLVHASPSEGCSNSIGMAMAHGWPVVAFDCAGNKELLGDNGNLVPNGNYPSLIKCAKDLKDNYMLRLHWGGYSRNRIQSQYSLKHMVDAWEEMLCGITSKQHS